MPKSLSPGDRKILFVAGGAFLLLVILGFLFAPASNTGASSATTYSTASEGAKAAYLLLQETGYHVDRWQHPFSLLNPDSNTVLIIADPAIIPNGKQKAAVEQFVSGGGRVITTGVRGARFLPEDSSEYNEAPKNPWTEFKALSPSAITRAAPKLTLAPHAHWSGNLGIGLYGDDEQTVVTHFRHGKGDILWMASATPLTNAGITQPGNLEFLLAAIGDKQRTHVLFDEYVHGYGEREEPERSHPLMTALLLQSVVLAFAAILTFSRRSGPLRPLPAESRLAPLEFVETLGGLYQQAHAASVAVDVYYQRFQYWTTRRLGIGNKATPEDLDRAVRERWGLHDDKFLATLQAAAAARYRPDLPQKEALGIVQSLYSYAVKLKLFPAAKEKH
jgi:Domain of unknown function (DUF4350)